MLELHTACLNDLDLERHQTDSTHSFKAYFKPVNQKIQQYKIPEDDIQAMGEECFLLGSVKKVRTIFSKDLKGSSKLLRAAQDDQRVISYCSHHLCKEHCFGSPFIYQYEAGNIQDSWLRELNAEE